MNKTLYMQMNQKDFTADTLIKQYIASLKLPQASFWEMAFITEFYGYYKVKQYAAYLNGLKMLLEKSQSIPAYFDKILLISIEGVKIKIAEEALNKQFLKIIKPYENQIVLATSLFSLIEISIKAKDKLQAEHFLTRLKPLINTTQQEQEFERLQKMINSL